jgi:hypothetical protein
MALQPIPNQPISFEPVENCPSNFNTVYQLIKPGDKIQFQFKIDEPCSDDPINLIENGGFQDCETEPWDLNGCWECSLGYGRSGVCWNSDEEGCDNPASLSQIITPTLGDHIYRVRFQVYEISRGSLTFQIGLLEYLTVTTPGVYEVYVVQTGTGSNLNFNFMPSSDFIGCIDNIEMIQMDGNGYQVTLFESDGTFIQSFNSVNNDELFNFSGQFITFTYEDTQDFPNGCFYLCIKDFCDCPIVEFNIDLESPYEVWIEGGGDASFNYEPTEGWIIFEGDDNESQTILSPSVLCIGFEYTVEYVVNNGTFDNAEVRLECGSFIGTLHGAPGTYSETFTATDDKLRFYGLAQNDSASFTIDSITITPVVGQSSDYYDYCSQPFEIFNDDKYCTNLIEGCNDSDAFGFKFIDSGFKPSARVQSKLMPNNYNTQGSFETNSLGTRSAKYAEVRTARNLRIIDTPIYLWDFLARWIYLDHPTIEGEEYAFEEDSFPDVSYNKFMTRGTGSLSMGKKTQNMFKTNCSNESNC